MHSSGGAMKKQHRYWTDWVRLQSNRQLLAKYDEVFEVQERQGYSHNLNRRINVLTEEIYRRGIQDPKWDEEQTSVAK
jgi:hypothetical protein